MDLKVKQQILELAITAPSGDNCQPHRFRWNNDILEIYHVENYAHNRKYNFNNHGSALSFGCLSRIIERAASIHGYKAQIEFTPDFTKDNNPSSPWLRINFSSQDTQQSNIDSGELIKQRHVNRETYKGGSISTDFFNKITKNITLPNDFSLSFFNFSDQGPGIKKELINNLSYADTLVFKDKIMFEDVSKWVHLSRKAAEKTKDGMLYNQIGVKTFEVPSFALIKSSPLITTKLYNYGFGHIYRTKSKQLFESSAGVVIIWSNKTDFSSLFAAGKIGVELWINFNAEKWGVQPLTSPSAFYSYTVNNRHSELIDPQILPKMTEIHHTLRRICGKSNDQWPVWMFRVGLSDPLPTEKRSLRRPLDSFLIK